jgi:hypothetical protein
MRSTNDGTSKGSLAEGTPQSGGLLSPDELALPAICGQTGKAFLMVGRRQGRWVLELIRAVAIAPVPSVTGMPVAVRLATSACTTRNFCSGCGRKLDPTWTFCSVCGRKLLPQPQAPAAPSGGAGGAISGDPAVSFQALNMSARIQIGGGYDGCPYCRAMGYFHCGCGMFSCWNEHNRKPHLDHTDVWCAACELWRCTSKSHESDDSLSELTAYAAHEKRVNLSSRIAPGSARRDQINRPTSIRGYLG